MEISVALCSDGNMSCKVASVRTCSASSQNAEAKPPIIIKSHIPECSTATPNRTSAIVIANKSL